VVDISVDLSLSKYSLCVTGVLFLMKNSMVMSKKQKSRPKKYSGKTKVIVVFITASAFFHKTG